MTKRTTLSACAGLLLAGAGIFGACNDVVSGKDCKVQCQDVDNTCVQKCTDDACKTTCNTDLDNCVASCGTVTAAPPSNPDASAGTGKSY